MRELPNYRVRRLGPLRIWRVERFYPGGWGGLRPCRWVCVKRYDYNGDRDPAEFSTKGYAYDYMEMLKARDLEAELRRRDSWERD